MGNVPAKEDRQRGPRRRGSSITSSLSNLHQTHAGSPRFQLKLGSNSAAVASKSSTREKERFKEAHAQGLVVKYDENVDGGYLAPYGVYNLNLDYKISIVKECIIERRIAPFFTPLQDHDASWSDDELLKVVDSLKLHALPHEAEDEDEDLAYDIDAVDELTLSKKDLRRHLSKKFNKELKLKKLKWQQEEEKRFKAERATSRQAASRGLKLLLYKTVIECPICFLYYPRWINYSRCCNQAICSECFVQIKRLEPHYPHDTEEDIQNGTKNDPNLLISEPACCPYCATSNFGVTYQPPTRFRTGQGGIAPGSYKPSSTSSLDTPNAILEDEEMSNFEIQDNYFRKQSTVQRRGSLPPNHSQVVTTDCIRPDWQQKLNSARAKLAKRAAAASAIHASNMLIQQNEDDLEQKMIEEAMRLSLLDEETRQRRESSSRR